MKIIKCKHSNITSEFYPSKHSQTVLLIHGYGLGREIFHSIIPDINAQVYNLSLPGFNQTKTPDSYDLVEIGKQINLFIKQNCKIPVHIFGHSLGAYCALEAISEHPSLYSSLGLIHSHPFGDSNQRKLERKQVITFIQKWGTEVYIKEAFKKLFKEFPNQWYNSLVQQYQDIPEEVLQQYSLAMSVRKNRTECMENIPAVWLCSGKFDTIIPLEYYGIMASKILAGKWEILKNSGHMGFMEEKEDFLKSLNNFLNSQLYVEK